MFTANCYRGIELHLGFKSMFSASLEAACNLHSKIIDEVKESIIEWAVPVKEAIPVLIGLGYSQVEISDGIRLLREESKAIALEAEYSAVDTTPEEEAEEEAA